MEGHSYDIDERSFIKERARNIMYIENPSEELQLLAVYKSPYVIKFIENPTDLVIKIANRLNPDTMRFVCK